MSVRMRHTREHTANRRSHHALKGARLSKCSNCGEQHLRHRACASCGTYRGRQVVDVAAKMRKRAEKLKARGEEPAWFRDLGQEVGLTPALHGTRSFSKFLAASDAAHESP